MNRLKNLRHGQALALMVLVALMWSTAGVVSRHLQYARSFEVTFWRSLFAVIALGLMLPLLQGRAVFATMRHAGRALWISGVCWGVIFTAYMVAMMLTTVGNALVTLSVGPLLTAVAARIFIGHRMALRTWLAIVVAGIGIGYMFADQVGSASLWGTLVALGVPIAGAINFTLTQHAHDQGQDVDLVPAVWLGALFSSAATLPLSLPLQANLHDIVLLGSLGVFQLAVPCALCVLCARVLKAPEISLLQQLEIIFGIVLAWLGAGEVPTAAVITGGTLVIGALLVNELLGWRERI